MFLCINNYPSTNEFKKMILFIIPSKRIKYLGVNLTKEAKDLYTENCKMWLKAIKVDTNKWRKIFTFHKLKDSILRCQYYPSDLQI